MQNCYLHVIGPFTCFGLKWTTFSHNIVFSDCLHALFYVVAIFLSSHVNLYHSDTMFFIDFIALLVALCMLMN